jgi:hypothetical protein
MATDNPTDSGAVGPASTAEEDAIVEQAVLTHVLVLHPAQLTILELARMLDADGEDFARKDAVERALRELTRDGLLHCDRGRVWPTRAALRFDALLGGAI